MGPRAYAINESKFRAFLGVFEKFIKTRRGTSPADLAFSNKFLRTYLPALRAFYRVKSIRIEPGHYLATPFFNSHFLRGKQSLVGRFIELVSKYEGTHHRGDDPFIYRALSNFSGRKGEPGRAQRIREIKAYRRSAKQRLSQLAAAIKPPRKELLAIGKWRMVAARLGIKFSSWEWKLILGQSGLSKHGRFRPGALADVLASEFATERGFPVSLDVLRSGLKL